jgi:hypothetical protein
MKTKTLPPAGEHVLHRHHITLKSGHGLSFFFNETTGLLVVDVNHRNERGGNEIIRRTIDPDKLVAFAAKLPPLEDEDSV